MKSYSTWFGKRKIHYAYVNFNGENAKYCTWYWSITMQNILSDFGIFIDIGYFPGTFGLIFVYYGLLNSSFIGSFTLLIFVSLQQK